MHLNFSDVEYGNVHVLRPKKPLFSDNSLPILIMLGFTQER